MIAPNPASALDGIGSFLDHTSPLRRKLARVADILEQADNVVFVRRLREHVGGKIAVGAFGAAEGHRDVETEGHPDYSMGRTRPDSGLK